MVTGQMRSRPKPDAFVENDVCVCMVMFTDNNLGVWYWAVRKLIIESGLECNCYYAGARQAKLDKI